MLFQHIDKKSPTMKDSYLNRLKKLRRLNGLQQKDLAFQLGITQSAVARIEKGVIQLKLDYLIDFASVIGLTLSELVCYLEHGTFLSINENSINRKKKAWEKLQVILQEKKVIEQLLKENNNKLNKQKHDVSCHMLSEMADEISVFYKE